MVGSGRHNKIPQNNDLNSRPLFLTAVEARSPRSRGQRGWFLVRLTDGLLLAVSSYILSSVLTDREGGIPGVSSSSCKDANPVGLGPSLMTSFNFNYLPKGPSLKTVTLGVTALT